MQNNYNISLPVYKKSTRKMVSDKVIIDKLKHSYNQIRIDNNIYPKTSVKLVDIKHAFED